MRTGLALALATLLSLGAPGTESDGTGLTWGSHAHDGTIDVGATKPGESGSAPSSRPIYVYERKPWSRCSGTGLQQWCVDGDVTRRTCTDGSSAQAPLFRHEVDATGHEISPWDLVDSGGCPEDGTTPVLTAEEFARLPLAPSPVHLQPGDGRALVHYGVIATSDPTPQTLTTTILGTPITVTATPTTWTWDYGDGTLPRTTTDPGRPYPDTSGTHPYDTPGTYQLTLTTTWTGTYQINDTGPQHPVTGTATTTTAALTITVETAHPHLVTGP